MAETSSDGAAPSADNGAPSPIPIGKAKFKDDVRKQLDEIVVQIQDDSAHASRMAKTSQRILLFLVVSIIAFFVLFEEVLNPWLTELTSAPQRAEREAYISTLRSNLESAETDYQNQVQANSKNKNDLLEVEEKLITGETELTTKISNFIDEFYLFIEGYQTEIMAIIVEIKQDIEEGQDSDFYVRYKEKGSRYLTSQRADLPKQLEILSEAVTLPNRKERIGFERASKILSVIRNNNDSLAAGANEAFEVFDNADYELSNLDDERDRLEGEIEAKETVIAAAAKELADSKQELETAQRIIAGIGPSGQAPEISEVAQASALRIGAVILVIYLAQILVSYSRYHFRMASRLTSQANALKIAIGIGDLAHFERLVASLSPDQIDFGKMPTTPTEKILETVKASIEKIKTK